VSWLVGYHLAECRINTFPSACVLPKHRNLFTERACCRRQSHFVYVGQDISGSPVNVDVGTCRAHCGGTYDAGLLGYSRHSSMLDFLRSKKVPSHPCSDDHAALAPSCGVTSTCQPTGLRVSRVMLLDGLREVEVIEDCHCEARMSQCLRVPALKTYHPDTPYETVVDAGKCAAPKTEKAGFSCVPTKFDAALVETPNKVELVQTVEACNMEESCYRVPYVEYYYEVTYSTDGVRKEMVKEIDVGRCLGSCTPGNRCLLRNSSDPEGCLLWAEGSGNTCIPQGYESHTFLNQHGQIRTVLAITSCVCQP
uniref:Im:7138239 n=1 Tax=Denticeps clupeoides TaxID=299321 RepID=A0AAY3ZYU4_9TELE